MELHVGAPARATLDEQVAFMQRAESLGFSGAGVAEDRRFGDPFETLRAAADATSRIWLYPAVVNPVSRTPEVLANQTRDLFARAPGRIKLAIGAGDAALSEANQRPASLRQLKSAIVEIRSRLSEGSTTLFDRLPKGTPTRLLPPPVLLAASGAKNLETAGQTADGVLVTSGLTYRAREAVMDAVAQGAINAGRRSRNIPITYYSLVSIDEDRDKAIERTRPWIHFWLGRGMFNLSLRALEMPTPRFLTADAIPSAFLHRLANELVLAGTPREVSARVARLNADGVSSLFLMLPGGIRQHEISLEQIASHVLIAAG
jgi:alkanesulfonate monooxygenase SsuD/methylene tetrahydromethanopterin reductase-like flavin-dependent oxidoreductase (luciferase family)